MLQSWEVWMAEQAWVHEMLKRVMIETEFMWRVHTPRITSVLYGYESWCERKEHNC